jgi:transcriptional antiterminator NusG
VEQQPVEQTPEQQPAEQTPEQQPAEQTPEQQPAEQTPEQPKAEPQKEDSNSHYFAIRTTGGQEKIVLRVLENRVKTNKIDIQSVLLVDNLKGYVVIEALGANEAFNAIQGVRHIRGQLRGELEFKDIEGYLVKVSTVTELAVDKTVEIIGGPFKGMKATVTRVDFDKEEATVILLDAPYQLPVTVDANYLKLTTA